MKRTDHPANHATYTSYTIGFVLSIILTLAAYFAVVNDMVAGTALAIFITALAIIQLLVQLIFFLHVSAEGRPRWNLTTFLFAALVVLILALGSLWIMYNLNYNMMPHEVEEYIQDEELIQGDDR